MSVSAISMLCQITVDNQLILMTDLHASLHCPALTLKEVWTLLQHVQVYKEMND